MRNYATDNDVIQDLYLKLVEGGIGNLITGNFYLKFKPFNSKLEDCVVSFISGRDGQIQTGIVTVNIFVPNVTAYDQGGFGVENYERTEAITKLLNDIVHNDEIMSKGHFYWEPNTMVSTFKEEKADYHAHFVNVQLLFQNSTC